MADPDPQQQRLDELEEEIEDVRRKADEHGNLPDDEHEQTLSDPEGDGTDDPYRVQPGG